MGVNSVTREKTGESAVHLPGREVELAIQRTFLTMPYAGPSALFIAGEAGIGKSAVWGAGVTESLRDGWTVLTTRAAEAECALSFTGLTDLLEPVADDVVPQLPEPLGNALEVALLRRTPGVQDSGVREVGFAVLAALRLLTRSGPLLVAVDDLSWLDPASAQVLAFALRRLADEPLKLLTGQRTGLPCLSVSELAEQRPSVDPVALVLGALSPDAVSRLELGPLAPSALTRLIAGRLGFTLPARAVRKLHAHTGGNPLWTLAIAKTALSRHGRDVASIEKSIVDYATTKGTLADDLAARIDTLPGPAQLVLLVVAALAQPSPALVHRAVRALLAQREFARFAADTDTYAAFDAATQAGVVETTGNRTRPTHPLLGSVALARLGEDRVRMLRRRLAELVADPEQRARQLAVSADDRPDADVAAALDTGAGVARARGAVVAAAELGELAVRLTPESDVDDRARRAAALSELLFLVGDVDGALHWARDVLDGPGQGLSRLHAGLLLAALTYCMRGKGPAAPHAVRALAESDGAPRAKAQAHVLVAELGDLGVAAIRAHARQALAVLDELGPDAEPEVRFLATALLAGADLDESGRVSAPVRSALEAVKQRGVRPVVLGRVGTGWGGWRKDVDDLAGARHTLQETIALAQAEGDDAALPMCLGQLALTEFWAGRYLIARAAADRGLLAAESTGVHPADPYLARAALAVHTGDAEHARDQLPALLAECERNGDRREMIGYLAVLGAADLLDRRPAEAVRTLRRAAAIAADLGIGPGGRRMRLDGDLAEALIGIGEFDEAEAIGRDLLTAGANADRPALISVGLRVAGLVATARREFSSATELLEQAAGTPTPYPLDRGRTLLALGKALGRTRAGQPDAVKTLREAESGFATIGARPWQALAADLVHRAPSTRDPLTAAERRVAEMVATGRTNRQVAADLVVSVRTVEGHLAAVYRKLDVSSRTALTAKLVSS